MTPASALAPAPAGSVGPRSLASVAVPLLQSSLTGEITRAAAIVLGLAVLAGVLSALVSIGYRWYVRERAPAGLPILAALSGVVLYLNTSRALSQVISGAVQPFDERAALFNVAAVLVSAATARAAIDVGDRIGSDVFVATGGREIEADVGRMVQAVGRVITVEIPEDIDDIVGYDPVPETTKAKLAGRTFVFPRRLTVEELRDRLITRLKADYAVGHVDVDLTAEGEIEYLALGSRAAGIGPTLPPETSAVAIRADPAFSASAGDLVQVWESDPPERLLTAEVRGVTGDVVTLAVDTADTRRLDDDTEYKLVTLPVEKRADREFVSLFRAADETMAAVEIPPESELAGLALDATGVTVVAVRPADGPIEPLPSRDRHVEGGDTVYVVATPEAIRRLESAAAPDRADPDVSAGATLPPEHRVGPGERVAGGEPGTDADGTAGDADATTADADASSGGEPDADESAGMETTPATGETTADGPDPVSERPSPTAGVGGDSPGESDPDDVFDDEWGLPGEVAPDRGAADDTDPTVHGRDDGDDVSDEGDGGVADTGDGEGVEDEAADVIEDADEASPTSTDDASETGDVDDASETGDVDDPEREDLDDLPGTDVDDLIGADDVLDDAGEILSDADTAEEDGDAADETAEEDGDAADETAERDEGRL